MNIFKDTMSEMIYKQIEKWCQVVYLALPGNGIMQHWYGLELFVAA